MNKTEEEKLIERCNRIKLAFHEIRTDDRDDVVQHIASIDTALTGTSNRIQLFQPGLEKHAIKKNGGFWSLHISLDKKEERRYSWEEDNYTRYKLDVYALNVNETFKIANGYLLDNPDMLGYNPQWGKKC